MKRISCILALVVALLAPAAIGAQEPVSSRGRFSEVNGARMYFEDHGSGDPLLLLHNFGATASVWQPYIADFSNRFRVIAWDMRGHGRSSTPDATDVFLHANAANDLLAIMDSLGIRKARAIGASAGGITLLHAATVAPERFEALVLVGAQIYYSQAVRKWIESAGPGEDNPELMKLYSQRHGPERGRQVARQFWRFRNLYGDPAFTPDKLGQISARVLIVHGDNDFVPITQAWEMFNGISGSRLWIVPNGGHLPFRAEENRSDFTRRVIDFLENKWQPRTN
jgi:pimeloyl-ACP methyl ester carboxylesterase